MLSDRIICLLEDGTPMPPTIAGDEVAGDAVKENELADGAGACAKAFAARLPGTRGTGGVGCCWSVEEGLPCDTALCGGGGGDTNVGRRVGGLVVTSAKP